MKDDTMRFAGDLMMTTLLTTLRKAGVDEMIVERGNVIVALSPRLGLLARLIPLRGDVKRQREAEIAVAALFDDPERRAVYGERTFGEALAFRLERFYRESGKNVLIVTPSRYEVRPLGKT